MSAVEHTEFQKYISESARLSSIRDARRASLDSTSGLALTDAETLSASASDHGCVSPRQHSAEVDVDAMAKAAREKVLWRVASAACWAIGIGIIIISARMSVVGTLDAVFTPPPGFSGGWIGFVVKHWPSCILFLFGKIASDASKR